MIDTARMRSKIEAYIASEKANHEQGLADWDAFIIRSKAEWVEKWGAEWQAAAERITERVRNGDVVTGDELPKERYSSTATWSTPYQDDKGMRRPDATFRPPSELIRMLDAIELLDEPLVSHTALAKVGINPSVMGNVSRYLSRGYVT